MIAKVETSCFSGWRCRGEILQLFEHSNPAALDTRGQIKMLPLDDTEAFLQPYLHWCYLSPLAAVVSSIAFMPRASSNHGNVLVVVLFIYFVELKIHFPSASRNNACNSNFAPKRAALCCTAKVSEKLYTERDFYLFIYFFLERIE